MREDDLLVSVLRTCMFTHALQKEGMCPRGIPGPYVDQKERVFTSKDNLVGLT